MTAMHESVSLAPRHPLLARWTPAALLVLVGLLLYGHTLSFPFVFDDHIYLLNNPLATDARSFRYPLEFRDFATRAKSLGLDEDLSTNLILRPFAYLTFYVNHALGGMKPPGFRAVNIVVHCANAVLLLELLQRLLRHAVPVPAPARLARFISLSAALLFLAHPLQIESVTYVIQRFTSLGAFFYLATVLLFVVSRTEETEARAKRARRWSIAALGLGTFTKEFLFTAPILLVLLDWLVLRAPFREACRRVVPWALFMPVIPILMGLTAAAQTGATSFSTWLNVAGTKGAAETFPLHYALTQPSVVLTYLRLMFLPTGLNIDPEVVPVKSALDWRFFLPLLTLIAIFGAALRMHMRDREDPLRTVGFCCVLWMFLGFSIDSTIVPLPDLMSEHRSYLSTLGVFGAVACAAGMWHRHLQESPDLRYVVPGFVGVWVFALMVATFDRHEVWRGNLALWSDTAAKSPGKARVWSNLGTALGNRGLNARAAEAYRRAIAIDPRNVNAHFNLIKVELRLGNLAEALQVADRAVEIDPRAGQVQQLRGEIFMRTKRYDDAARALGEAFRLRGEDVWGRLALAEAYARGGRHELARAQLNAARALPNMTAEEVSWFRAVEAMLPGPR